MSVIQHQSLRSALASCLGEVLTPEVAAWIESQSLDSEDRSHDPEKFGKVNYKGVVLQVERLSDILDEIHPLHEAHFAETEVHRHGLPLDVDYDYMVEMERRGQMLQFTARCEGELVGNIRMYIQTSLHTGTLYATEDTFYVLPEHRKGWLALKFWRYMEDCVKAIGVREVRTDSKVVNNVHRLNEYCGYTHVANKYVKLFTE